MDKASALAALAREMEQDRRLPLASQANFVFGEGNPDCDVLFVGEGPGYHEDVEKRPFVGRAGQLLREMIRAVGWKEADVYITNIVKRRPPENRDPLPEEIAAYKPYLTRQIEIIRPKAVVALGRFAMNYFIPEAKITRDHGRVFRMLVRRPASGGELVPDGGEGGSGYLVIPLFHPAAALRSPEVMRALREAFLKLPELITRGALAPDLPPARPPEPPKAAQTKLF
jgi:DNA polymerase